MPKIDLNKIKIALVHDFLNQYGGAERVLAVLHEIFPEAPIYTLLYDPAKMRGKFSDADVRPSFLQKFPMFLKKRHRLLLPFLPTAPETFNLRDFDLVISSSGAWSKGIIVKPKTIHICYCHSPMRFAWDWNEKYLREQGLGSKRKIFARLVLNYIRMWDKVAADRPDFFIANSLYTKSRIKKYYGRDSVVIYPPVEIMSLRAQRSNPGTAAVVHQPANSLAMSNYFLIVSRLSSYKKIDVAIEAFNKLNLPLVIIGEGDLKYMKFLKSIAGPKTKFLGWKADVKIQAYYANCRAFLFPGEDDFGIAPVEAMSFGKPVIALRRGGAKETIVEGVTGEFYDDSSIESLADAVRRFLKKEDEYKPERIMQQAETFSKEKFEENLSREIGEILNKKNLELHGN